MKKAERSTYTSLDFLSWDSAGTLVISPKFQRRSVWTRPAKSYLIDTLLLGLPVPPIYLRVVQAEDKKSIVREVVDGQQRVTAILEFLKDKYSLAPNIESKCHGKKFSQLTEDQQDAITQYSLICEVFHGVGDTEILQIFSRMNMNSVKLNDQELRNGKYFGPFKRTCYQLGYNHLEFWRRNRIFAEMGIARMKEVELTSELIVAMIAGQQHKKKSIDTFYKKFDEEFSNKNAIEKKFKNIIDEITSIFDEDLKLTQFKRPPLFYSMFLALYHRIYGLEGEDLPMTPAKKMTNNDRENFREAILELSNAVEFFKSDGMPADNAKTELFIDACIRSTDNLKQRNIRLIRIYEAAFS